MSDGPTEPGPPPLPVRPFWHYAAAFVVYVALGLVVKSAVLNWIVGPVFLVVVFAVLPRLSRLSRLSRLPRLSRLRGR